MKKKEIIITSLALISLVLITVGVTYAFFSYAKTGSTENTVTTGTITFLYTEISEVGKGISLTDAFPMSDTVGKAQVGEGKVFNFKVTSTTPNSSNIPYEVTVRKASDSTLDESAVKLYLTKVSGTNEEEILLNNYSNLTPTTKVLSSKYTEKTIYQGNVPSNTSSYEQAFRLRMWVDEDTDFSQNKDGTYPYNGKTFKVTVNVYANAKVVTEEEVALESNANIKTVSVENNVLTPVEKKDCNYETTLPDGTASTTINIETENPNATVKVEKIDSLAYGSNIKRLSTYQAESLVNGDNYFKVTVTSENKKVTLHYIIKITVGTIVSTGPYYEFGTPTTSSTTDYKTLGKNVFAKKDGEELSICIISNETLECFKPDDELGKIRMQELFGTDKCYTESGILICSNDEYYCTNGYWDTECRDNINSKGCTLDSSGTIDCRE